MGLGTALAGGETGSSVSMDGGNGLADVWIIGEPFFRDVQVAFNVSSLSDIRHISKRSAVEG